QHGERDSDRTRGAARIARRTARRRGQGLEIEVRLPASRAVIEVVGIRKTYGATVAVDDVSFTVNDGEIFGLIGPNGAGKTTTMECVEGLRTPDRGTVAILGLDPLRDAYKLQERIGVQLQQAQLQKRIK